MKKKITLLFLAIVIAGTSFATNPTDPVPTVAIDGNPWFTPGYNDTLTGVPIDFSDSIKVRWQIRNYSNTAWVELPYPTNSLNFVISTMDRDSAIYRVLIRELRPGYPGILGQTYPSCAFVVHKLTILPTIIRSFTGSVTHGVAQFNFNVESENGDTVFIQSSVTGTQKDFRTVAIVTGLNFYSEVVQSTKYYRLKVVSADGSAKYSGIVVLKPVLNSEIDFSKKFTVIIIAQNGVKLNKQDFAGRSELSDSKLLNNFAQSFLLNRSAGTYFVSFKQEGKPVITKQYLH